MLRPDQFVANKALDFDGWVQARREGVTATEIAHAATPAGYRDIREEKRNPPPDPVDNHYMRFGREQEPVVAIILKEQYGIMPNEWLVAHALDSRWLATPDGMSLDHDVISEIKTTGTDWNPEKIPIRYHRQVQWQLFVTDARRCLFAWWLRVDSPVGFVPAWMEPKTVWIERDDEHIAKLLKVAEKLYREGVENVDSA